MNNQNLVPAKFYFDESETNVFFDGLHKPGHTWNGWAMPLISKDSINDVLEILHCDYQIAKMDGDNVHLQDLSFDDNEADILEPIEIDGKIYYDFSWLGFCFQSKGIADYEESLHQEARDLMDAINDAHKWDSKLSLDEYIMTHIDDLSQAEVNDIKTLLDKFDNL